MTHFPAALKASKGGERVCIKMAEDRLNRRSGEICQGPSWLILLVDPHTWGKKPSQTLPLQPQSKLLGAAWAGTFHPCALVASLFAEPASKTVPKSSQESHDLASFAIAINYWTDLNVSLPPLDQPELRRHIPHPITALRGAASAADSTESLNRGEGFSPQTRRTISSGWGNGALCRQEAQRLPLHPFSALCTCNTLLSLSRMQSSCSSPSSIIQSASVALQTRAQS